MATVKGIVLIAALAALLPGANSALQAQQATGADKPATNGLAAAAEDAVRLGEIVVTAPKESAYDRSYIGREDIEGRNFAGRVDELLENVPGIDLSRKSFGGSDSRCLSIRGFDESRSLIMRNGRSLHGAGVYGAYYVDWASLSLEDVESVELIRGMAPVKYGNTLGGVVNISTAEGYGERQTEIQAGAGSLGTWNRQARHSGSLGSMTYSLSAGRYETDGYLRNAFVDRDMVSARLGYALPADVKFSTSIRYTENEAGMIVYNMPDAWDYDPGEPDSLASQLGGPFVPFLQSQTGPLDWGDGSYWKDRRLNLEMALSRESEMFDVSLRAALINQDREEYFYAIDDPNRLALRRDSEPEKNNWGWNADFVNRIGNDKVHLLEYGLDGEYLGYGQMTVESFDPAYFGWPPTGSPDKHDPITTRHGAYVQDLWNVSETVELQAGVRVDSYRAHGPEANAVTVNEVKPAPRLACVVKPWQGCRIVARAGQAYRFPTNPEYYWWYSGYQPDGRSDLRPEKADQYELDLTQKLAPKLSVSLRGYYYRVDDYIRTIFGYRPSRVVYNIDRVDFSGVELEATHAISENFAVAASFTHQRTEKRADVLDGSSSLTDDLPELPDNKANLKISYGQEGGLRAELAVAYVDRRWSTQGDLTTPGRGYLAEMDSYLDVDARVSYPVYRDNMDRELRLEIAGDNLLDDEIVEEYGYPLPGAIFMAGMRAVF